MIVSKVRAAIEDQVLQVAGVFTEFIGGVTASLDIAIYDFRLLAGALTDQIVSAVRAATGRGVSVRLAYDRVQGATDDVTLKAFTDVGCGRSRKRRSCEQAKAVLQKTS